MGMTATEGWNSFNFLSNNHQQQLGNLCNLFSVVSTFFFSWISNEKFWYRTLKSLWTLTETSFFGTKRRSRRSSEPKIQSKAWEIIKRHPKIRWAHPAQKHFCETENSTCKSAVYPVDITHRRCDVSWIDGIVRECVRACEWYAAALKVKWVSKWWQNKVCVRVCMCCWGRDHHTYYYTEYKHQHEYFFAVVIVRAFPE